MGKRSKKKDKKLFKKLVKEPRFSWKKFFTPDNVILLLSEVIVPVAVALIAARLVKPPDWE